MRTATIQPQQKGTFLISPDTDEQEEPLNLAQAIRDMLGWANKRRTRLLSPPDVRLGRGGSMLKAYRYKLEPNQSQRYALARTLDVCRELYNDGLYQRK